MLLELLFRKPKVRHATRAALTAMDCKLDQLLSMCPKRILYAEDDCIVEKVTTDYFAEFEAGDISVANTTSQFDADIMANNLAFIFADVMLPGGGGSSVEIVYKHWSTKGIKCPIFFYSGMRLGESDAKLCEEMGATFFNKPLDLKDLKKIVETILAQTNKL